MTDGGKGYGRDFFVSYCQADRAWAEWIAWELESAGFRVLVQAWDAVPGTNWPALVADGVARGGRMLAVVSPLYLDSVVATAEWQAVWAADPSGQDRLLVPVRVAECDNGLLDTRVSIDLTGLADTEGDEERAARGLLLDGVRAAMAGRAKPAAPVPFPLRAVQRPSPSPLGRASGPVGRPPPVRGRPVWCEPLPELFVARPGPLGQVREMLVDPSCPRVVGLVGMGGAGKSTLARATAGDAPVQAEFADGIVWVDVGPSPDLPGCQARVLAAFGDTEPVLDVPAGVDRLRRLLDGARCLLVLDNVWDVDQLRAFDVAGSVRLLVTTRSRDALFTTTHAVCELGPVDEPTARQVLARYARCPVEELPDEATTVIRRCGGLVLALAISGGMVAEGRRWANVAARLARADLGTLAGRFPDYPHPDLLAALEASIAALPAEQRVRYVELAVFEGSGPVPLGVAAGLWQATSGMDLLDGEDLLLLFGRRSLAVVDPHADTFTLHDLLFDYARAGVGAERLTALHGMLVGAALSRWGGVAAGLPALRSCRVFAPADQYALGNTVAHLLAAGQGDTIHDLLAVSWPTAPGRADNAWFTAHERAGLTAAYLADVRAAWRCAERATDAARERGQPPTTVGLEYLYALVIGSIASIAGNVPPTLLARLVEEGVWPVTRALAYAEAIPDPATYAEALAELAPHVSTPDRATMLSRALDAAAVYNPLDRADALARLAPHLPEPDRMRTLGRAIEGAAIIEDSYDRAWAVGRLAAQLPEPSRTRVLARELGTALDDGYYWTRRLRRLRGLSPHLPASLHRHALELVCAGSEGRRAEALGRLAAGLPEPDRSQVLGRALDVADHGYPDDRARTRIRLALYLPEPDRTRTLGRAVADAALAYPSAWAEAVGELAPHLPADLLGQVLNDAWVVDDEYSRAVALGKLAPHLPGRLLGRALHAAAAIDDPYSRALALGKLAPHLRGRRRRRRRAAGLLGRALDLAAAIDDPSTRARALGELAPHLPEPDRTRTLGQALDLAAAIGDPSSRLRALGELASYLPEPDRTRTLGQALDAAAAIDDPRGRAAALAGLAPHLPAVLLGRALEIVPLRPWYYGADALGGLAPHLPPDLLGRALDLATTIDTPYSQAQALGRLAPHLPPDLLGCALDLVTAIDDPPGRARALGELAAHLPEPDRTRMQNRSLDDATAFDKPHWRAEVLGGLAPHLPPDLLGRALDIATIIDTPYSQAEALGRLAPHLPEPDRTRTLDRALDAAAGIGDPSNRTLALGGFAPHLPPDLLGRALDIATIIDTPNSQAEALGRLAPHLPEPDRTRMLGRALGLTAAVDNPSKQVSSLGWLAPHLPADLLGRALDIAAAIDDPSNRARALGRLAPYLPADLLGRALDIAAAIDDPPDRARALGGLAPHLPESDRTRALGRALEAAAIDATYFQTEGLGLLAPCLPVSLLGRAVEFAAAIDDPSDRARTLGRLAPHLPEPDRTRALGRALEAASTTDNSILRAVILRRLATHRPELTQALDEAATIRHPRLRGEALASLAPRLPADLLGRALDVARTIADPYGRAHALGALAPHLREPYRIWAQGLALDAAAAIGDPYYRAKALGGMAPYLPAHLLRRAIDIADDIDNPQQLARALGGLAPYLPEPDRKRTLLRALSAVAAVDDPPGRMRTLRRLARHLPPDLFGHALDLVAAVDNPSERALALVGLAHHLPSDMVVRALDCAAAIDEPAGRAEALATIARWQGEGPASVDQLWRAAVGAASHVSRRAVLTAAPHFLMRAYPEVGRAVAKCVDQVLGWWP